MKNARDGVFLTDADGVIQWVNPAAAELVGFETPEELLGKKAETLYALPSVRGRMVREIMEKGKVERFVALVKRRGGGDWWGEFSAVAVQDDKGRPAGIAGIFRDITERVNLAREVMELTEQNEIILNTISSAIATLDRQAKVTYVNEAACRLAGQSRDALMGSSASETLGWVAGTLDVVTEVMRTGLFRKVEGVMFAGGPGGERSLDLMILPLHRDGETVGAIVEGNDVTSRTSGRPEGR